jgi:hypothetical protein
MRRVTVCCGPHLSIWKLISLFCSRLTQVRSSNGQAVIRVERSGTAAGSAADGGILPEIGGLPVVNCSQPAPWSTPPKKTYKQVKTIICFSLVKAFFRGFFEFSENWQHGSVATYVT